MENKALTEQFTILVTDSFCIMLQNIYKIHPTDDLSQHDARKTNYTYLFQQSIGKLKGQYLQIYHDGEFLRVCLNNNVLLDACASPLELDYMAIYYNQKMTEFYCSEQKNTLREQNQELDLGVFRKEFWKISGAMLWKFTDFKILMQNLKTFYESQKEMMIKCYQYIAMKNHIDKIFRKEIKEHVQEEFQMGITRQLQDTCENVLQKRRELCKIV